MRLIDADKLSFNSHASGRRDARTAPTSSDGSDVSTHTPLGGVTVWHGSDYNNFAVSTHTPLGGVTNDRGA